MGTRVSFVNGGAMEFKIVVDSGGDITQEMGEKLGIEVIPMMVIDGDKEYKDGVDILPDVMYEQMIDGTVFTTSQISVTSYMESFKKYALNHERVLYIGLSSGISDTFQAASVAAGNMKEEFPGFEIELVDSLSATMGMYILALETLKRMEKFSTLSEAKAFVEYMRGNIKHIFSVDDLQFLYRGGRLSKLSFLVGGALNIKPILSINKNGKLESIHKVRGVKAATAKLVELFKANKKDSISNSEVVVLHGYTTGFADSLIDEMKKDYPDFNPYRGQLGCTIGAHTGPWFAALIFLTENPDDFFGK